MANAYIPMQYRKRNPSLLAQGNLLSFQALCLKIFSKMFTDKLDFKLTVLYPALLLSQIYLNRNSRKVEMAS